MLCNRNETFPKTSDFPENILQTVGYLFLDLCFRKKIVRLFQNSHVPKAIGFPLPQSIEVNPSENDLMQTFVLLGIGAGQHIDTNTLSPEMKKATEAGMADSWNTFDELRKTQINTGKVNSGDLFGGDSLALCWVCVYVQFAYYNHHLLLKSMFANHFLFGVILI